MLINRICFNSSSYNERCRISHSMQNSPLSLCVKIMKERLKFIEILQEMRFTRFKIISEHYSGEFHIMQ